MQTLHIAKWVVPVSSPPLEYGALLVQDKTIKAVGKKRDLISNISSETKVIDHGESILMPAFVNCHCHLELSWLYKKISPGLGFEHWLKTIMKLLERERENGHLKRDKFIKKALKDSMKEGVLLIGDVSNLPYFLKKDQKFPFVHLFLEIIHPKEGLPNLDNSILEHKKINKMGFISCSYAPHSLYTCSLSTIAYLKKLCKKKRMPMTIHLLESKEEVEFLKRAKGPLLKILKERGRNINEFFRPFDQPVLALAKKDILDEMTICVHCTFISRKELEIIKENNSFVCLCPRSNSFIHGELPKAHLIYGNIENVCIGTDSLASNWDLSILSELKFLYDNFHAIDPFKLIKSATINGAKALGFDDRFGSLAPQKDAAIIKIISSPSSRGELYDFICSKAQEKGVEVLEKGSSV